MIVINVRVGEEGIVLALGKLGLVFVTVEEVRDDLVARIGLVAEKEIPIARAEILDAIRRAREDQF